MANRTRTHRNEVYLDDEEQFILEAKFKESKMKSKSASTYDEFLLLMRAKGYEIKGETFGEDARKYISFRPLGQDNYVRGSVRSLGKEYTKERIKDLGEIIKYAEQYKANRAYHIGYKKAKNPDAYFGRYESQIILYGGAKRMLEQAGINLKSLNVDKLKSEYEELTKQKNELTATYKKCEKEVRELNQKLETLNKYLDLEDRQLPPTSHDHLL